MSFDFAEYSRWTDTTAVYPSALTGNIHELMYLALGLGGEAGEIQNKVKKIYRDDANSEELRSEIAKEIGDVLWYVARLARSLDVPIEDIVNGNILKLSDRKERGVLKGSGDNR
jgi:NTP pyrophosphatase (non-canonical NTP hydrolase)